MQINAITFYSFRKFKDLLLFYALKSSIMSLNKLFFLNLVELFCFFFQNDWNQSQVDNFLNETWRSINCSFRKWRRLALERYHYISWLFPGCFISLRSSFFFIRNALSTFLLLCKPLGLSMLVSGAGNCHTWRTNLLLDR